MITLKCAKCGRLLFKHRKDQKVYSLDGIENPHYCVNCNAVESVMRRFKSGAACTIADLNKLPSYLIFDPNGDNPQEEAAGINLSQQIKRAMHAG